MTEIVLLIKIGSSLGGVPFPENFSRLLIAFYDVPALSPLFKTTPATCLQIDELKLLFPSNVIEKRRLIRDRGRRGFRSFINGG